ncbi:MAG TPA: PKD domain-containing protein, partial [bacterium]|nr:PKD domain-containing protein [bacterium]
MKNRLLYIISVFCALLIFLSCQHDPFSATDTSGRVQIRIVVPHLSETLGKIEAAEAVDRVHITVTASDMDTVRQDLALNNGRAQGEIEVKKGDARRFVLTGESQGDIIFEAVREQDISQDTEVLTLTIPLADFIAQPDSGLAPLTVRFQGTASSEGAGIASWSWEFGDGSTSTEQNPTHVYEQYGIFSVRLAVQDSAGSRYTEIKEGYVAAAQLPTAKFAALPFSGEAPLEVEFKDFSLPGTANITEWSWMFGDGDSSSASQDVTHTYQSPGLYSVKLRVRTSVGTDTKVVSDYINVKAQGDDPTVDFSAEPDTVIIDREEGLSDPVSFNNLSDAGNGSIPSYLWQFGDGESSTEVNPTHRYRAHGDYLAS